jgi:hypothetical protein
MATMNVQASLLPTRIAATVIAALLGLLAIWTLAAEIVRPGLNDFPANRQQAERWSAVRGPATAAASIGMVRGDLWVVASVAQAAPFLFAPAGTQPSNQLRGDIESARATAERAARLSPHDARAWLVLAGLGIRLQADAAKTAETLKLSYYTGSNDPSLAPLRLSLAVQSDAIADTELQSLVELEIQRIVDRRADLKPAIAQAYANARPQGRAFIEATLRRSDPAFLATITGASRRP